MPGLLKLLQKIAKEGILPNSFYEATITLKPKPDKDNTQKRKLQLISLMNRYKNPQHNFSKQNSATHQKAHTPWSSWIYSWNAIPGFFNICKLITIIHHINKLKDKNHMIISIDAEKAFDKISTSLWLKLFKNRA